MKKAEIAAAVRNMEGYEITLDVLHAVTHPDSYHFGLGRLVVERSTGLTVDVTHGDDGLIDRRRVLAMLEGDE